MSVIPEYVLQNTLVRGIRALRQDPRLIRNLFKDLPQKQVQAISEFVQKKNFSFNINYPQKDISLPGFVLIMKNEQEAETFMGNSLGAGPGVLEADEIGDLIDPGFQAGTVSDSSGLSKLLLGPLNVSTQVDSRITLDASGEAELTEFIQQFTGGNLPCLFLHIVQGPGAGEILPILRMGPDYIDTVGAFSVQLTTDSKVVIREANNTGAAIGEPSREFSLEEKSLIRRGANYDAQYQLHIVAGRQDEVLYLYAIVKQILLSQTPYMEEKGIMALRLSASDFAPKSELLPTESFQRTMNLQFKYPFSFVQSQEVFESFEVCVTPEQPGVAPDADDTISLGNILI